MITMYYTYVDRTVEGQTWRFRCSNCIQQLFIERADEETLKQFLQNKNHLVI